MDKEEYRELIINQMTELGIYQKQYDLLIDTMAMTCELRDQNLAEWSRAGFAMVIQYTNKAGATNISKSPFFLNNLQFNEQILKYGKELGLSPSATKKLGNPLAEAKDDFDEFMKDYD